MVEDTPTRVDLIRTTQRNIIQNARCKQQDNILGLRRIGLQDVSESVESVSLAEFKVLLSELKKKSVSLEVLRKIKQSCVKLEYIEAVFKTVGSIPSLIRLLIGCDTLLQVEAASCFVNLACGPHKCSLRIAKTAGAYFVSFLSARSCLMQDLSAWAIGNIANDCFECFKYVKAQGCLHALLAALESPFPEVLQSVCFALNACTRYEDPDVLSLAQSGLVEKLFLIMLNENASQSTFSYAAFTLSNCCYWAIKHSWYIFDVKVTEKILDLLVRTLEKKDFHALVAVPLLRSLGFLSYDSEACRYISKHSSFSEIVQAIAKDTCSASMKELLWILSNITVSKEDTNPDEYLPQVIDALGPFLRQQNSTTLLVLNYLLCAISKDASMVAYIKSHDISSYIQFLLDSEQSKVSQAAKQFVELTHCL